MTGAADFSVVLLTRNGGDLYAEVLQSLFACDGVAGAEVLQVDSGSTDRTLEIAARHPDVRVHRIEPDAFGHGRTRNLAMRLTAGPAVVFLTQDATPATPDFLARLLAPLADPRVAGVYARQLPRPDTHPVERFYIGETYPETGEIREDRGGNTRRIRDIFFSNVASALRRSVWEHLPFDEHLVMSEDQKWASDAVRAGHRVVYEPRATVLHAHNYRMRGLFRRNFDSGRSLAGLVDDTPWDMMRYERAHLARGIGRLGREHGLPVLLRFVLFEATRVAGFALGHGARWLPGEHPR